MELTSKPRIRQRWRLWALALIALVGIGVTLLVQKFGSPDTATHQSAFANSVPIPSFSISKYLNAGPNAQFVGSATCAECHPNNHKSYHLTAHSTAFGDVNPQVEPPDGTYEHAASGRSFRVYRHDGQLRHEELARTAEGKEVARIDLPVRYVFGSGHFARGYLVDVDGFLLESPITWYTKKKKWDMSPGYDLPVHASFERRITARCLHCHVGRVDEEPDSVRVKIHEKAIGCESCHGPGAAHAAARRADKRETGAEDLTIVNPARLPRPLLEAVCASCHSSGPASVPLRGRSSTAFRPGRPLTDYRIVYRLAGGNEKMTVVGHFEQLRRSACYQKSDNLSCVTCHDPHRRTPVQDPVAFYRQKCLDCHAKQPCRLQESERLKQSPADNCMSCHMPHGDTDIPHLAFSHHRIGLHGAKDAGSTAADAVPTLEPTEDVSAVPALDQQRNLALAYMAVALKPEGMKYADVFRERAWTILDKLYGANFRDGEITYALAQLALLRRDFARVAVHAQEAVDAPDLAAEDRSEALFMRAISYIQDKKNDQAIPLLERLVRMRRAGEDWRFLGILRREQQQPRLALDDFKQSLAIRPFRFETNGGLGETYNQLGDFKLGKEYLDRARWLYDHNQK